MTNETNVLFPIPDGRRNADDMGYQSSVTTEDIIPEIAPVEENIIDAVLVEPKWKRETRKERRDKKQAMINICHYCKKITREPLKVEREVDGKRLKLENFGSVYFHARCKVLSLMEGQLEMNNLEDTSDLNELDNISQPNPEPENQNSGM